jgi:lysophospholipase L1-like esterase
MEASATRARGGNDGALGWRRSAAFTALVIMVMLLLLEGAVRIRAWMRYGSAEIGMVDGLLVPDAASGLRVPRAGYVQESDRISIRVNSLGFRGDDITVEKPARTVRIATLGASTTFCGEVSNNDATWPSRLQAALQRAHPEVKFQVINAGVPGYVAADSLKNLTARVLRLEPDVVTYYEANNDLAFDTRLLAQERGLLDSGNEAIVRQISRFSLLFDLVHKNLRILAASRSEAERKLDRLPSDLPSRYISELEKIRQELASRNIPMAVSTFFVKYRRDQPKDVAVRNASISFYYMPWMTIEGLFEGIDLYNDALVQFARAHDVAVIDDRTSIPGDDQHFADWAHFADAGAAAMGERMARFLEDRGLIRQAIERLEPFDRRATGRP